MIQFSTLESVSAGFSSPLSMSVGSGFFCGLLTTSEFTILNRIAACNRFDIVFSESFLWLRKRLLGGVVSVRAQAVK